MLSHFKTTVVVSADGQISSDCAFAQPNNHLIIHPKTGLSVTNLKIIHAAASVNINNPIRIGAEAAVSFHSTISICAEAIAHVDDGLRKGA